MLSLLMLGIAVGWVALWVYVFTKARNRGERVVAVLTAVLIPFWDWPFGFAAFRNLCETAGGLRVNQRIEPQKAICADFGFSHQPEFLLKKGFEIVEVRNSQKSTQFKRSATSVEKTSTGTLMSTYCLVLMRDERLQWNINHRQLAARDISSGAIAATFNSFTWRPGWWRPSSVPSEGQTCHPLSSDELITTLRIGAN